MHPRLPSHEGYQEEETDCVPLSVLCRCQHSRVPGPHRPQEPEVPDLPPASHVRRQGFGPRHDKLLRSGVCTCMRSPSHVSHVFPGCGSYVVDPDVATGRPRHSQDKNPALQKGFLRFRL